MTQLSCASVPAATQRRTIDGAVVDRPVITLEASIWYYAHQQAADNAAAALPCSKLVWILRNPLPHARSLYFHLLAKEPRRLAGDLVIPAAARYRDTFIRLPHMV